MNCSRKVIPESLGHLKGGSRRGLCTFPNFQSTPSNPTECTYRRINRLFAGQNNFSCNNNARFLMLSAPRLVEGSEQFKEAVGKLSSVKEADNQTKLKLYALFKQATAGKNSTKKPGMLDIVGKAKWEAWNSLGEMSKVINILLQIIKPLVYTFQFQIILCTTCSQTRKSSTLIL